MAVYVVDGNLAPVLLTAVYTCFVLFVGLGIVVGLERAGLGLVTGQLSLASLRGH